MLPRLTAAITALGAYVPEDKLTNADLEKMVDTNDEWINPEPEFQKDTFSRERG